MIGDRVHIIEAHKLKSKVILPYIVKAYKKITKPVMAIAGCSGVGKTEISLVLQQLLWEEDKIKTKIISTDNYYSSDYIGRNRIRKKTKIIGKKEINWKKLNKIIDDYKTGKKKIYTQKIHRFLTTLEYSINDARSIDIIIVEGLYSAYADVDYRVYLNSTIAETYDFRKLRGKENPDDKFRQLVVKKESESVNQSKKLCDLVISWEGKIEK